MKMLNQKDMLLISNLRQNSRETLTRLSRKTNVPISTIYDKLKLYQGDIIKKHTSLLYFNKLGYNARVNILLKIDKEIREELKEYLNKKECINSVFKINNGYDFMIEGIFRDIRDVEDFLENLEEKFRIRSKQVYYIVDEVKREGFMSDPSFQKFTANNLL
jgi:DNA-binding Lrp family transcriptional regulator